MKLSKRHIAKTISWRFIGTTDNKAKENLVITS